MRENWTERYVLPVSASRLQVKYWQNHTSYLPQAGDSPWLPSPDNGCLPPTATLEHLPLDHLDISTGKGFKVGACIGPNNCSSIALAGFQGTACVLIMYRIKCKASPMTSSGSFGASLPYSHSFSISS